MRQYALPEDIRGRWIWVAEASQRLESYVFFRRDVTLFETPASAELWITARTRFHLFINGRHLTFGPPACPNENAYVAYLDIGFLVETGRNTIAVLAHNTRVSRFGSRRQPCGLWAQLNVDGEPLVWSDDTWLCHEADCYLLNQPRADVSGGFVEYIDLGNYPEGWQSKDHNVRTWQWPDQVEKLTATEGRLEAVVSPEWTVERRAAEAVVCRGTGQAESACTWVSFAALAKDRGGGVYVGEAYLYSDRDEGMRVEVYADDPYVLFANGQRVNGQGIVPLPPRTDLNHCRQPCFRQAEVAEVEANLTLRKGWNRLILGQQAERESAGVTLIFPEAAVGQLTFVRGPEEDAPEGWSLYGPFRTPLALLSGNVDLTSLPRTAYDPFAGDAVDLSAVLGSWAFRPLSEARVPVPEKLSLRQGEYVVLDFGYTMYGCPEFTLKGTDDDIVDLVCGEHYAQGQLLPMVGGRRCVDTMVLGPGTSTVRSCRPRGMRYAALFARHAAATVEVSDCRLGVLDPPFSAAGSFACSDAVLNDIWEVSRRTLSTTFQVHFLDSPTKDQTQYIADAMIQSWAAYHVYGTFDLAAKSIEEFARIQFETGEMNAVCPSDMFIHMPDYSLMWPVWLQRHYLYTGDEALLRELLPNLQRLLGYYHSAAIAGYDVLSNLHKQCGAYCFLDHGDIDREGIVTGLNAIYCRALLSGAWLFSQAGDVEKASVYRRRAAHVARTVRSLTWDEERGLFADGWDDGQMSEFYSWQSNVLAIYGGIALPEQYGPIFDRLFCEEEPFELFSAGDTNNPYFKHFVLESAFALERREWAMKLIRWYWGRMLDRGAATWWELFDPAARGDEIPTHSLCHGYGVSPSAYLCTELAGVRPATPGFGMAYFNPLVGAVQWVKARIPTPRGHINVDWHISETGELEAMIDANYPLEVIPILMPGVAERATIHVSEDVTILAEDVPDAGENAP